MSSDTVVEVITGATIETHKYFWKVENFHLLHLYNDIVNQQKFQLKSNNHQTGKSTWEFRLTTYTVSTNRYCRVLLKLIKSTGGGAVSAKVKVVAKKDCGTDHHGCWKYKTFNVNDEVAMLDLVVGRESTPCPWMAFVDPSNILKLAIELSILHPVESNSNAVIPTVKTFKNLPASMVLKNLGKLLKDDASSDVTLICSDETELKAHKLILTAQSEVFASMFQDGFAEKDSGVVRIKDVSGKTMRIILEYLYTGRVQDSWCDPDTIVEFTYAAGKYQLCALLEVLDNVLGKETETSWSYMLLLSLAGKLSLKKAEVRLMERVVKLATAAETSEELIKVFENAT